MTCNVNKSQYTRLCNCYKHLHNLVSKISVQFGEHTLIFQRDNSSPPQYQDWLWRHPNPLSKGYHEIFPLEWSSLTSGSTFIAIGTFNKEINKFEYPYPRPIACNTILRRICKSRSFFHTTCVRSLGIWWCSVRLVSTVILQAGLI
jgi:hypothetical protein